MKPIYSPPLHLSHDRTGTLGYETLGDAGFWIDAEDGMYLCHAGLLGHVNVPDNAKTLWIGVGDPNPDSFSINLVAEHLILVGRHAEEITHTLYKFLRPHRDKHAWIEYET